MEELSRFNWPRIRGAGHTQSGQLDGVIADAREDKQAAACLEGELTTWRAPFLPAADVPITFVYELAPRTRLVVSGKLASGGGVRKPPENVQALLADPRGYVQLELTDPHGEKHAGAEQTEQDGLPGRWVIVASAFGYPAQTQIVEVRPHEVTRVQFELKAAPPYRPVDLDSVHGGDLIGEPRGTGVVSGLRTPAQTTKSP